MKKILIVIYSLFFQITLAQEGNSLVTISFNKLDLKTVLFKIEEQTSHKFFFQDSWLEEYTEMSGNYKDMKVEIVLEDLFKDTVINYYMMKDGRIILTRNNTIYDELTEDFFGTPEETEINNEPDKLISPVFRTSSSSPNTKIETVRIGKALKGKAVQKLKLSGYLTNRQTKKPIPNVTIVVNGKNVGAESNANGFYEVRLNKGINLIEFNSMAMENVKKRVIIYSDGNLNVSLDESIELLDEIILQAEINKNVEDVETKTVVDVKESKNIPLALGERDVLKVATALPGISVTGEGAQGYNVRGGKSDQNLILLDDAVIYNPQHFFGIFSALNPFSLGDVNIYKNGIPAEYGGRLSSVFDLSTKDASTNKITGEASIGPVTGNLLLETPIVKDKSGLMAGGRVAYANWLLNSLEDENLKNSEASFYDVIAKYNHRISDKSKIEATAYASRDDFSITSDSLFIYENRALSLRWNYRFSDRNSGKFSLTNSQYNFDIEFDGESNDDFRLQYKINETELKLRFDYLYNNKIKFDYGISSKLYTTNPGKIRPIGTESIVQFLEIEKERGLESAAFLTAKVDLTDKFSINAGFRYSMFNALGGGTQNVYAEGVPRSEESVVETLNFDNNEIIKTYSGPEYRFSTRYLLSEDFSVKGAVNRTLQYIHVLSNNTTVSPIDTWKLSDLNIEPQSAVQYSLGFYKNFNNATYELSLEGFYKKSNNILDFNTGGGLLLKDNIETEVLQGKGKSYGVEFLLKKQKGKFYGWLGYTYSRSFVQFDSPFLENRINDGDFFPSNFDKPHDFSLVANYKFTKRLSLSTNFVYQTGRPVTIPIGVFNFNNADFAVFSDRNAFRIPDFYRLDIGFNIEGNHKRKKLFHSFVTISVYNVLGRNNPYSVFFVTEEGEVKGLQSSIFSVPVPSITYNFKF